MEPATGLAVGGRITKLKCPPSESDYMLCFDLLLNDNHFEASLSIDFSLKTAF